MADEDRTTGDGPEPWVWARSADDYATYAELARYVSPTALVDLGLAVEHGGAEEPEARDLELAERLYERLREKGVKYSLEPRIPRSGQMVRSPRRILRGVSATCLDIATTYAGMCLEAQVEPLLAVGDDHAFVLLTPGRSAPTPDGGPEQRVSLPGFGDGTDGVLVGTGSALVAEIDKVGALAIDCVGATRHGEEGATLDFAEAVEKGRGRAAAAERLVVVDVPWLHVHGFPPREPPPERTTRRFRADRPPFETFTTHEQVIADLRSDVGRVVLLAPSGRGKSTIARLLAHEALFGAGWFLTASDEQTLINSLAEAELAELGETGAELGATDREGYAQSALQRLHLAEGAWVVVLDNADDDPGKLLRWIPRPDEDEGQLLLVTTTNPQWRDVPGYVVRELPSVGRDQIERLLEGKDLAELVGGRPLLWDAFRRLKEATGWSSGEIARFAPPEDAVPEALRGPAAVWSALRQAPGSGERELQVAAFAAYLPPDHQPLVVLEGLVPGAAGALRLLVEGGLLTMHEDGHSARLHRLFGAAVRRDLEAREPARCHAAARVLTSDPAARKTLDEYGDLPTITELERLVLGLDTATTEPDTAVGVALHGLAELLELHAHTRRSGEVYEHAERHLQRRRDLLADCLHGRARTVNQHHARDEGLLRQALAWATQARAILLEEHGENANADRCLAMQGLLMQKLARFPLAGETRLGLLREALAVLEEADERRRARTDIEPAELARSHFNLAGIRILLAQIEGHRAAEHLAQAHAVYETVAGERRRIYGRDVHPHIAACVIGLAYVDYNRALLLPGSRLERTILLRAASDHTVAALKQREALEGSLDLDETRKCLAFLAKVNTARQSLSTASEPQPEELLKDAVADLTAAPALFPTGGENLHAAIDRWARSSALAEVVAHFDGSFFPHDLALGDLLAWLDEFSERWDYRKENERNLVAEPPSFASGTEKLVLASARALGLVGTTRVQGGHYDHVLILGGLMRANLARPLYAARLLEKGTISAGSVTALGGYRPLKGDEIELVDRIVNQGLLERAPADELDAMDAGVRNAFGVGEPLTERGEESETVGASWRVREYATSTGLPVRVVAAPSTAPGRRANTADTYAWFASEIAQLEPGQRVLLVTSDIYVPYQHADALRMLALPYGVDVETAGMRPGDVDPRLSHEFKPHNYLQEIRSTIRALRALHDAL